MQKKNKRLKQRQRQRLSRKMVLLISTSGIACLAIALTIFFHTGKVEKSMAAANLYLVPDEKPVVDMTLEAPVIRDIPTIGPNTILAKTMKAVGHPAQEHHE